MRCLWLIELRRGGQLLSSGDEDCELISGDGTRTLRQVKKREGDKWTFTGGFRQFIERAFRRFAKDQTVRHEFYTHVPVAAELVLAQGGARQLNPLYPGIGKLAGELVDKFCSTVSVFDQEGPPNPQQMHDRIIAAVRSMIEEAFGDPLANDAAPQSKVSAVAARLFALEFRLMAEGKPLTWSDVSSAIGFDDLVNSIEARARARGSIIPWQEVDASPERWLDGDGVVALNGVRNRSGIRRPALADAVWSLLADRMPEGAPPEPDRDVRLVLMVGARGSGKTWMLLQLGQRFATERPEVAVSLAVGPPPSEWGELSYVGLGTQRQHVVLIDELFPEWSSCFGIPLGYLPDRVVFIATAAADVEDPEIAELRQHLGRRVQIVEVPATPTEEEFDELAQILRTLAPAGRERRAAARSNFRHAAEILTGHQTGSHLADFEALLRDHIDILTPLMACSTLRIPLPLALLERELGGGATGGRPPLGNARETSLGHKRSIRR